MPRFPVSDHCDGELFFNPHACTDRTPRDLLRWWRTRTAVPWPTAVPVGTPGPLPGVPPGRVAATFIGHSTFLLRTTALSVLTDPVFTRHAGPLGLEREQCAPSIRGATRRNVVLRHAE